LSPRLRAVLVVASVAALTAGCSTLPPSPLAIPSYALDVKSTDILPTIARDSAPSQEVTGVRLLPLGVYSLDARIALIGRAQRSLDLQYYIFENDSTGRLILKALQTAAVRGVRVRLLVDDLNTTESERLLRALAGFPGIEVRLFNPFCCNRGAGPLGRYAFSIVDFNRLNHRMHNKMLVADGVMAIAGGRNIADEYFLRSLQQNFVDLDALIVGSVVKRMGAIFDEYWNNELAFPVQSLIGRTATAAEARREFDEWIARDGIASSPHPPPVDVLGYAPIGEELTRGRLDLIWGKATAIADPPEKVRASTRAEAFAESVNAALLSRVWAAQQELILTSPYLVPGPKGMKLMQRIRDKGGKVTIVTNSLAATDEPLVHNGYARYRTKMLKAGIELYELSPTRTQKNTRIGIFGSSRGGLHAKLAVIDRNMSFIGSMNLDPRSADYNTEFGLFIDSPALAAELLRVVGISRYQSAYRVILGAEENTLRWLTIDDDNERVLDVEPEVPMWMRWQNSFMGWFVPDQLL
jgi:putative cardiolipin synthase